MLLSNVFFLRKRGLFPFHKKKEAEFKTLLNSMHSDSLPATSPGMAAPQA